MALALRRAKNKETLLFAGGKWDFFERRFVSLNPQDQVGVIYLEESQVAFTEWFAGFLHDYREGYPRDISLALAAGDRRAGKTFAAYFCQIAALIDVPRLRHDTPTIGWTVSKTYRERAELNDLILNLIPDNFYKHKGTPEHRYDFVHGPVLRNLSADDPDSLKQGRVDFLLYNEPQKMQARAIVHGLYGTADKAGLAILAANRPSEHDTQGEWLYDLKEAVDEEIIAQAKDQNRTTLGAVFFGFSSRENTKIDQPARKRVARLAAVIDKAQAEADDAEGAGDWKKPGERASKEFKRHRHVVPLPDAGARDCTAQVASERGTWGDWSVVAGADFQDKSWAIAGVVAKLLGDPADPTIHFCDEHYNNSDERLYLETFEDRFAAPRGYEKHNVLWIGDASGSWQTAKHEEGERTSFSVWAECGWTIIPPQEARGDTGRARNPFVDDQLVLWNELLRRDRIRFDPARCEWLIACVKEAKTKRDRGRRRIVQNKYAHALSAALYLVWRLAPKPRDKLNGCDPSDFKIVPITRRGY